MGQHKKPLKICPNCIYSTEEKKIVYCEECGNKLITACGKCGTTIRIGSAKHCFSCGGPLRKEAIN